MTRFNGKLVKHGRVTTVCVGGIGGLVPPAEAVPARRRFDGIPPPTNYSAANVSALIADINAANTAGGVEHHQPDGPDNFTLSLHGVNNGTNGGNLLPVIAANDNLTIVGNGDTIAAGPVIRHDGAARFFDVTAGASLTLQNLTLQGG